LLDIYLFCENNGGVYLNVEKRVELF
jgi:hypothetical protein